MSWRDRINHGNGSFRGVPVKILGQSEKHAGRNTLVHEYPGREPYPEDNGPAPHKFNLTLLVIGNDYLEKAANLERALNTPGPGILHHPLWGRINVSALPYSRAEDSGNGGQAEFRAEFVRWQNNNNPTQTADTAVKNSLVVDQAHFSNIAAFTNQFTTENAAGWVKTDAESVLKSLSGELSTVLENLRPSKALDFANNLLSETVTDALTLVGAPEILAHQLTGAISTVAMSGARHTQLFSLIDSIEQPIAALGTASRILAGNNAAALTSFVKRGALFEAARTLSGGLPFDLSVPKFPLPEIIPAIDPMIFQSSNDAVAALDSVLTRSDSLMDIETDNDAFTALQTVSTSLAVDLRQRAAKLPQIKNVTAVDTLTSLTAAYSLYGDAKRENDIISRNPADQIGFLPGGTPLEVLGG